MVTEDKWLLFGSGRELRFDCTIKIHKNEFSGKRFTIN